jgi:amicyanin
LSRQHLALAAIPAAAAMLLLAGCAGADHTATSAPSVTFADSATTPGMTGMSGMPGMPSATAARGTGTNAGSAAPATAPAPQGGNTVDISNFDFTPTTLTIPAGATVTWTNHDEEPHTVAASDGSFHSPGVGTGGTYSFTFTNAGTYDYVCSIHPFMHGTVVVTK